MPTHSIDSPHARHGAGVRRPAGRLLSHVALAAAALLIFQAVVMMSGKIAAGDGLGWDGRAYARMVTDGLEQGSDNTRLRPLLPLLTRIPYALGIDIIHSFELMNYVYVFTLYLFVALILDLYGAGIRVKAIVVINLALCIATSKLFAFYPVMIDLGALALITAAFYFVITDRHWLAGAVCVLAVASREFGIAVLLCGVHRTVRRGRLWPDALWYLPGVAAFVFVRSVVDSDGALSANDALANLKFWRSPVFVTAFVYFSITVFGGISTLLALRPRWCIARLRDEPEQATFLVIVAGLAAVGNLDIWRYLMFALPAGVALIAQYYRDHALTPAVEGRIAAVMTLATVITQRPFERMDETLYFRDWFPLYTAFGGPLSADFVAVWGMRLAALILVIVALDSLRRSEARLRAYES